MVDVTRKGTIGILAGWSGIDPDQSGMVTPLPVFSAEQILAEFQALRPLFDPENFRDLERMILNHIQNIDNPHHDRIASLVTDIVKQVMAPCFPGTAPLFPPTYSMMAEFIAPQITTSVRNSAITVIDPSGFLVTVPPGKVAIDYSEGAPIISLWPQYSNLLADSDVVTSPYCGSIGGRVYQPAIAGLLSPNRQTDDFVVVQDDTTPGLHGYSIEVPGQPGQERTTSVFVFPMGYDVTHLVIQAASHPTLRAVIELATGVVTNAAGVIGHARKLPNGWWRIGLQYVCPNTVLGNILITAQKDAGNATYTGATTNLFAVFGPMHNEGPGMAPYTATTGEPVTRGGCALSLEMTDIIRADRGMFSLEYVAHASLLPGDTSIFTYGSDLAVTVNTQTLTCKMGDTLHHYALQGDDVATVAFTYGEVVRSSRHSRLARQTATGAYASFTPAATATLGSFAGGVRSLTYYPHTDERQALEFLIGETLP